MGTLIPTLKIYFYPTREYLTKLYFSGRVFYGLNQSVITYSRSYKTMQSYFKQEKRYVNLYIVFLTYNIYFNFSDISRHPS